MSRISTAIDRRIFDIVMGRLRAGSVTVRFPDGSVDTFSGALPGPHAEGTLHDWKLLRRLATAGTIGLADGYIEGEWDSPDLGTFIELAALQLEPAQDQRVPAWLSRFGRLVWRTVGRAAAPRGPLRATVEHYDLGNEFFEAWLDATMTYSSGIYDSECAEDAGLEDAQREKYRRLAESTGIRQGSRVLEIGSGWGGFALYAAGELGADVTTVTISKEQAAWVERVVAERGLSDRVHVRLEDFSRTPGLYDAVVSVEMIESIPGTRWPEFFGVLRERLAPGGMIGLQAITVADHHWATSNAYPDFARVYIFPGGQVPSQSVLHAGATAAGLRLSPGDAFGQSYARTLDAWGRRFEEAWPRIASMGFDERFRRMWRYYLAYCEGGFAADRVDVSQMVLTHAPTRESRSAISA